MLRQLIGALPIPKDQRLIAGFQNSEDAGVYILDDRQAVVVSIDVITPLVDDPETFGAIAAANALSDIYAMGGDGLVALSLLIAQKGVPPEVLAAIVKGGADASLAAGTPVVGGHSVESKELIFGLAVIGTVDPKKVLKNDALAVGDQLLLTQPLGTGTLSTALKRDKIGVEDLSEAIDAMTQTNRAAVAPMQAHGVRAATDITGFGLIGHAAEMAAASDVQIVIDAGAVPEFVGAREMLAAGVVTRGNARNLEHAEHLGPVVGDVEALLLDPQTSGGLLVAIAQDRVDELADALRQAGYGRTVRIGEVHAGAGIEVS